MKKSVLAAAISLGVLTAQPAAAQVTEEQLIDFAITQAKAAADATSMTRLKAISRRGSNCLFGRDSGYFVVGAGGPCNARMNLTTTIADMSKRELVTQAANKLLAASGQTLQGGQDYAQDAAALLEEAKELGEGIE